MMRCNAGKWKLYLMVIVNEQKDNQHIKPSTSQLSYKATKWADGKGKGLVVSSEILLVVRA